MSKPPALHVDRSDIFSRRLKQALTDKRLTQMWLAGQSGLSFQHINDVIKGRHTVSLVAAVNIAEALDISLDWLTGRTDNEDIMNFRDPLPFEDIDA